MKITLDLRSIQSPADAQAYLQRALAFPDYYGKNLDALYDMLTSWDTPAAFALRLPKQGPLAEYAQRLRRVFADAAAANPRIQVAER